MERKIEPIQPIKKTRAVRAIKPVTLHRRPRYRSKLKTARDEEEVVIEKAEADANIVNHAHYTVEGVGGHIDYKT